MDDRGQNDPELTRPDDAMTAQPERKPDGGPNEEPPSESILIRDLAPRANIKGGAAKLRFGDTTLADPEAMP